MSAAALNAITGVLGFWPTAGGDTQSVALSAAATWASYSFTPKKDKTVAAVSVYLSTKTGTPAASELSCDIYSDNTGVPNSSLESRTADSSPASGNRIRWSGFTTAVTAGTQYHFVMKNTNATPASNFPSYAWTPGGIPVGSSVGSLIWGWNRVGTVNSGAAWATSQASGAGGLVVEYSDGTFEGLPANTATRPSSVGTGDRAYGVQEVGSLFSLPAGPKFNVCGLWFLVTKVGSPGSLRYRLYNDRTLLGTTHTLPAANITNTTTGQGYSAYFPSPVQLDPTTMPNIRAVVGDATAGDTSSNGYSPQLYTFDSAYAGIRPMNGTVQKTVTTNNAGSPPAFTDTNNAGVAFGLILDTAGEFTVTGGGGGGAPVVGSAIVRGLGRVA